MKFTVSSSALLSLLATTGKVISNKSSLPILEYFLMELKDGQLTVTTSDLETTLVGSISVENIEREGVIAAPAKLMLDSLKEFPEMPLAIDVNDTTWEIAITWASGHLSIPGANAVSYPAVQSLGNGRKNLVKYTAENAGDFSSSFILPKKPANLLKTLLLKEEEAVAVTFDAKNVTFELKNFKLVCRLIEGNYPNYNAVIPAANPNKVLIDRVEFVNGIKRVAVCSNPTTNLIRMDIADNRVNLTAQDIDFSVSANETISCSYDGDPVTIGFKSTFLVEILSNIDTPTVVVELADSTRAGVFKPVYDDKQNSDTLMLLMPMMINA